MAQLKKTIGALFCVLCLLVPLTFAESTDFKNCLSDAKPVVDVSGVDVSPFPVRIGQSITIEMDASTGEAISRGRLTIEFIHLGVSYRERHDLCQTTTCPITNGNFTISFTPFLPEILFGHYQVLMVLWGEDILSCTAFQIDVKV